MKNTLLCLLALFVLMTGVNLTIPPPQAEISNGLITAKLYLPDPENGYYRGARFDWAGVMYDLHYKDHHYFGQWFENYSPTIHDAIMGPVDSFDPIGYEEAKTGEGFLRIGVGILEKPQEPRYTFSTSYKILNGGQWKTKKKSGSIEFTHELKDEKYQYVYTKTVQLTKGKPEMVLMHKLKNTGDSRIETNVYNHNFFVMDNQPTGPDFVVKFSFTPSGQSKGRSDAAAIEGQNIVYTKVFNKGEIFLISPLTGFSDRASDYDIRVENRKTRAGVRIIGDKPIVKFVYWSAATTLCPEPFTKVSVDPGQELTWKISYEFYVDGDVK